MTRKSRSARNESGASWSARREAFLLAVLLVATFALRAVHAGQPIVENYVGRQVPTAMVARNLERGSGFLRPQLDTAPLPNLFLVEPPIYALAVVGFRRATGLPLEVAGRLVSALALTLGAWGLFGLARRRAGSAAALLAVAAWAVFPITIRYGRAFQPDALMLGTLVAGLRCWDEYETNGGRAWLAAGCLLLAVGLAVKVIAAYLLIPLLVVIVQDRRPWKVALVLSTLLPALLWYAHALALMAAGSGSRASADNGALWVRALLPTALFRAATWGYLVRYLVIRAFTPLGFALAGWGLLASRSAPVPGIAHPPLQPSPAKVGEGWVGGADQARLMPLKPESARLWWIWGASALAALAVLAGKLHHEYYWIALAPVAAVGVGGGLAALADRSRVLAVTMGCGLLGLSLWQAASTWKTPPEWVHLPEAARAIRAEVPEDAWVVAPEALLYCADRRGCRLEYESQSRLRAAGEWPKGSLANGPLALVEFYRLRGARFVADLGDDGQTDPERLALHEAIRARYNVIRDTPGVLLAALTEPEAVPHGTR